ncbi:MAG: rod shape-determining protein RodA [Phycisphaerae bacterium]|nr:rod shape-determining protein RodA [Phycisphaerae bacterium]
MSETQGQPGLRFTAVFVAAMMLALMFVGLRAIDVSQKAEGGGEGLVVRQAIFAGVGLAAFAVAVLVPYQRIGRLAYPLFILTLALLLLLAAARFFHLNLGPIRNQRGAYRWIDLGVFQIQPSELAKLSLILLLAWYLRLGDHYRKLLGLVPPFVLTLVPTFLILIEPDLGTAILFLPILFVMLFLAGARKRHLLSILGIAAVCMVLPVPQSTAGMDPRELAERLQTCYWPRAESAEQLRLWQKDPPAMILSAAPLAVMEDHQLERISGWLLQGDESVAHGKGYHLRQSLIVLGSGKAWGSRDWSDGRYYFRMLPDDHTDFIFSIIAGQWGFAGCAIVLGFYAVIVLVGVEIAATTNDPFGRLLAGGVVGLLVAQVCINIGMTMGLMPITGMTLPLVSYGGSSLVINCAALGLLVNVAQRRPILLGRRPFEHKENTSHLPYRPLEERRDHSSSRATSAGSFPVRM